MDWKHDALWEVCLVAVFVGMNCEWNIHSVMSLPLTWKQLMFDLPYADLHVNCSDCCWNYWNSWSWLVYTFVKIHDYKWTCGWFKASEWWGKEQYWHAAVNLFLHCLNNNKFLAFKNLKTFCLALWYIGCGAKTHVGWNPSKFVETEHSSLQTLFSLCFVTDAV